MHLNEFTITTAVAEPASAPVPVDEFERIRQGKGKLRAIIHPEPTGLTIRPPIFEEELRTRENELRSPTETDSRAFSKPPYHL